MKPPRSGLLAAGNYLVDHVKLIDTWPSQDALASILSQTSGNGGGPYNVAKDLARLFPDEPGQPFPLAAAGLVGNDADGKRIRKDCDAHAIDTTHLEIHPHAPTSYTDVMTVASTGRRTFFHQRGANAFFDENGIDFSIVSARIFYLGYLPLLDALEKKHPDGQNGASILLDRARSHGMITILDLVSIEMEPGAFCEIIDPALPYVDVLLSNGSEASRLSGVKLNPFSVESARTAAEVILKKGVKQAVVLHEPEGAVILEKGGPFQAIGSVVVPPHEIKGAVGAGDAFAAGFLYGLHENHKAAECLRTGACVAASCLRDPATSEGIQRLDDCLALGAQWGFREFA